MALFLYIMIVMISIVVRYRIKHRRRIEVLSQVPCMSGYPLIGSNLNFIGKSPAQIFQVLFDERERLGPIFRYDLTPYLSTYYVSEPKIVESILSSQSLIQKSADYDFARNWLRDGLLLSKGKKWHQRRKIITPAFHFKILEDFYQVMERQGQIFVQNLEKFQNQDVRMFQKIGLYTLDVICETAMGQSVNAQIDEDSSYARAIKAIVNVMMYKIFHIAHRIEFFHRFTGLYKTEQKALKILHDFSDAVINKKRDELKKSQSDHSENDFGIKRKVAFLDLLLQAKIDGQPLTDADIREEVDTFMFAGHDTTTSGISFCLYNLALYPEIQQKVFEECKSVLIDGQSSMSQINSLSYLECVIKESQRIFPSVPIIGRSIREEITVNGLTLAENSTVNLATIFMGRDPSIFPDPMKFDPSRFSVELDADKRHPYAYIPFSAGPRNCIGQKYAMLEMKSLISSVVRNFEITIAEENKEIVLLTELILRAEDDIKLKFKKR